jgi:hypothetical protein
VCHENGFVCGFNAAVGLSGKEKCGQLNEKKHVILDNIYIAAVGSGYYSNWS